MASSQKSTVTAFSYAAIAAKGNTKVASSATTARAAAAPIPSRLPASKPTPKPASKPIAKGVSDWEQEAGAGKPELPQSPRGEDSTFGRDVASIQRAKAVLSSSDYFILLKCLAAPTDYSVHLDEWNVWQYERRFEGDQAALHARFNATLAQHNLGMCSSFHFDAAVHGYDAALQSLRSWANLFWNYL